MLSTRVSVCLFAVLALIPSTSANAQPVDQRTYFTFDQPVALPGVTLPAGKYLFRVVDTTSSRRVVQVLDADGRRSYALLLSIPAQRGEAPGEPEVRFMEAASGNPQPLKTWWYPGSTIGHEFIYPKAQAQRLAQAAAAPVLTTASADHDTTEEMKSAALTRVSAAGAETAVTVEAEPSATPVGGVAHAGDLAAADLQIMAAPDQAVTPLAAPVSTAAVTRTELPRTASTAPLMLLAGGLTLLAGLMVAAGPRPRV
jgi:hypothetical protein